jgi:hypothetical protein
VRLTTLVVWVVWLLSKPAAFWLMFLRETEERRIQKRATDWWIRIDDARKASLTWSAAFLQQTARLTGKTFDSIFGTKSLSFRLVGTSFCFALSSIFLWGVLTTNGKMIHLRHPFPYRSVSWGCYFFVVGLIPAISRIRWVLIVWYAALLWLLLLPVRFAHFMWVKGYGSMAEKMLLGLGAAFIVSTIYDVICIYVIRWLLQKVLRASKSTQVYLTSLVIVVCVVLAVMLVFTPVLIGATLMAYKFNLANLQKSGFAPFQVVAVSIALSFALNSINVLACFVGFLCAVLMLVHRLIWPVLERPVYDFQRLEIIKNKKLLQRIGFVIVILPPLSTTAGLLKSLWAVVLRLVA